MGDVTMINNNGVVWGSGIDTLGVEFLTNVLNNMQRLSSNTVRFGQKGTGKRPNYQIELTENESKKFNGHHGDFHRDGISEDEPFKPENLSIAFNLQNVQIALEAARKQNIV